MSPCMASAVLSFQSAASLRCPWFVEPGLNSWADKQFTGFTPSCRISSVCLWRNSNSVLELSNAAKEFPEHRLGSILFQRWAGLGFLQVYGSPFLESRVMSQGSDQEGAGSSPKQLLVIYMPVSSLTACWPGCAPGMPLAQTLNPLVDLILPS